MTVTAELDPGQRLRVVKFLAYGWSSQRSMPALRDQVGAALAEARHTGWDGLLAEQRAYLDDFWDRADVELDGDAELQQAVRFGLFHTLQAGARAEQRAIPAKGLTGPGYDGHAFWDTETFVLPVLTYTAPRGRRRCPALAPRDARPRPGAGPAAGAEGRRVPVAHDPRPGVLGLLAGRDRRLPHQRRHRRRRGALPGGDRRRGLRARGGPRAAGRDRAAVALARPPRRRRGASASTASRGPTSTARSPTTTSTPTSWPSETCARPPTPPSAIRSAPRSSASTTRRPPAGATPPKRCSSPTTRRWASTPRPRASPSTRSGTSRRRSPEQYPLLLHFPYFDLYRKQVVKQADLVLALHLRGDAFSEEEKARDLRLLRAADGPRLLAVGLHPGGHRRRGRPSGAGLRLPRRGRADGPRRPRAQHAGRAAHRLAGGHLDRAVAGFGGMRDHDGALSFAPRLPGALTRLTFRLCFRGQRLRVEVRHAEATYSLLEGPPLEITHHGEVAKVSTEHPQLVPSRRRPFARLPPNPRGGRRRGGAIRRDDE